MSEITAVLRRSWQAHFWTNLATTGILTLSFTLILGAILFTSNLSRIFSVWGDEIQITIYLKDDVTMEQRSAIENAIKAQGDVDRAEYIDKSAAAASFEKSLSSYGPSFVKSLKTDTENPFPASFQVRIKSSEKTPEKIESLAQTFTKLPGVEDVSYGQEWLTNYSILLKISKVLAMVFAGVLLASCIFAVSNSIQASLFSRKDEIEILELVGATAKTIRRPFLIEGAFQGLVAVLFSLVLITFIYKIILHSMERVMGASSVVSAVGFLPLFTILLTLIFGVLIGALGSYLCVSKLNTGWAAAQETAS